MWIDPVDRDELYSMWLSGLEIESVMQRTDKTYQVFYSWEDNDKLCHNSLCFTGHFVENLVEDVKIVE